MKSFRFEKLWLLSEKSESARQFDWSPSINILVGINQTGKSTAIRSLYSAFGCLTLPLGSEWDHETLVAVQFVCEDVTYKLLRQGKVFSLFDSNDDLLWATKDSGVFRDKIAEIFGFYLSLTTNGDAKVRRARLAFYFLPFYIDQDGSWQQPWNTFKGAGEFSKWQQPTIELALGIRPSEYWQSRSELDVAKQNFEATSKERNVLDNARIRLTERFPKAPWFRSALPFRGDIKKLELRASELASRQDEVRNLCTTQAATRDMLKAQLQLVERALKDDAADMDYLDGLPEDEAIECPTCGTMHDASFHSRLELATEGDELRGLRTSLEIRLRAVENESKKSQEQLGKLDQQGAEIEKILDSQRGNLKLGDIVRSAGAEQAHGAFDEQETLLNELSGSQLHVISELEARLKALENSARMVEIRSDFNDRYAQFAKELGVPQSMQERSGPSQNKPKQGGSGGPRAILAYYFALAHTAAKYSTGILPPLVVDSPHQQAQDDINRPIVTEFIFRNRVPGQQLIVGLEEPPPEKVLLGNKDARFDLAAKYGLLSTEEFLKVRDFLAPFIAVTSEAMAVAIQNAA